MSLVASDVGDAPEASETLGRRSFIGGVFCCFFPLSTAPFNNYLICCGGREEKSLTSDGGKLRGKDEVVIEWGLTSHSICANACQTRLCLDCGAVRVCLHCCCSMMEDTVRNMSCTISQKGLPPSIPNGKDRGNQGPIVRMHYVSPSPVALLRPMHRTTAFFFVLWGHIFVFYLYLLHGRWTSVLGYQSHLLQRCHPACGHERFSHLSPIHVL